MYKVSESRLTFPLYQKNTFVSAFNAVIVLGLCNMRGTYTSYFEFYLSDLVFLFQCFLSWLKVFSESPKTINNRVILTKSSLQTYVWKACVQDGKKIVVLILQDNDTTTLEVLFDYTNFNKFVQAIYFLTWQALCLSDVQITVLLKLMLLPFPELFEFKDTNKLLLYLKTITKKPIQYSFIIQYHLEIIFFLHKVKRIINTDEINERLNILCTP